MQAQRFTTTLDSQAQTVTSNKKEERKMFSLRHTAIALALTAITLFFGTGAFAQVGGVDADIAWIREAGAGAIIDLTAAPVPTPNLHEGLARSNTHYFYTTNGGGAWDTIFKIDIVSGLTVGNVIYPGANFQGLAFVVNADTLGNPRVYGLDNIGNQMVEFDPGTMTPTGVTIPIAPGIGRKACSGGDGFLFVQVDNGGVYSIHRYNTRTHVWGPSILTPMAGAVLFDGISFRGGFHVCTEVTPGGSNIWRFVYPGPWVHLGGGYPTLPFRLSAMGAN